MWNIWCRCARPMAIQRRTDKFRYRKNVYGRCHGLNSPISYTQSGEFPRRNVRMCYTRYAENMLRIIRTKARVKKISNFRQKLKFLSKIEILVNNWHGGQQLKFCVKTKLLIKIEFLSSKTEIFGQKSIYNFQPLISPRSNLLNVWKTMKFIWEIRLRPKFAYLFRMRVASGSGIMSIWKRPLAVLISHVSRKNIG